MLRKLIVVAAWCALAAVAFLTLSPIGLRPSTGSVGVERFAAYGLLGVLFVLAYPRHFIYVAALILAVAASLEALQHLTPDRHGHFKDAMEKVSGGLTGCSLARLAQIIWAKLIPEDNPSNPGEQRPRVHFK